MYRLAPILIACLCMANAGGAALIALSGPNLAVAGIVPLALPLSQKPAPGDAGTDPRQHGAGPDASLDAADTAPMQEIAAGLLTGSLAAVLTLKILYGRRRRDDAG